MGIWKWRRAANPNHAKLDLIGVNRPRKYPILIGRSSPPTNQTKPHLRERVYRFSCPKLTILAIIRKQNVCTCSVAPCWREARRPLLCYLLLRRRVAHTRRARRRQDSSRMRKESFTIDCASTSVFKNRPAIIPAIILPEKSCRNPLDCHLGYPARS